MNLSISQIKGWKRKRKMSQFATPNRGYVGMQPSQQAPASPPKGFGYVSGSAPSSDNLNGYVGGKPAVRSLTF